MSVSVHMDFSALERRFSEAAAKQRQTHFAMKVANDTRKFVPRRDGPLQDYEPLNSDYPSGRIVWSTPYARYVYNLDHVVSPANPSARPQWAEAAKAEKMHDWKDYAASLIGSDGGVSVGVTP